MSGIILGNFPQHTYGCIKKRRQQGRHLGKQRNTVYRKQLYDLLKDYYLVKGTEFLHKFDNYFANDDNISIDSEAIQQLLIDNPDGFNEFVKFLLDARNFGKEFDKFVKFIIFDISFILFIFLI